MDHEEVVRQQMTEKYLLKELDSADRDQFEEHYFSCPECAADVHAGTLFVDHARELLAEKAADKASEPVSVRPRLNWFSWLRPALALPALLLIVVGYQNLVTIPRLARQLNSPRVLPFAAVNVGTYGSETSIQTRAGEGFLVFVRIPPDDAFVRYVAELSDPAKKLEWSIAFPASAGQDEYPVEVPREDWKPGSYALDVHGVSATGESKEVGKAAFAVQVQQ